MTPDTQVRPGDADYQALHDFWVENGRPGLMERLAVGWQYRAINPDGDADQPIFVLVASMALTSADTDGPPRGYAGVMGTRQSSLPGGNRSLSKE